MSIEVKVPVLPESVSDATIAAWHKKVGDAVLFLVDIKNQLENPHRMLLGL